LSADTEREGVRINLIESKNTQENRNNDKISMRLEYMLDPINIISCLNCNYSEQPKTKR
jgi:hypothetical protein